jgi:hypothetical protein
MVRDNPKKALKQNVPGADYYATRPKELKQAIRRTVRELRTYSVDAC